MDRDRGHRVDSRDHYRDRDRDRDRDYDRDPDVERLGRGESYRPGRSLRSPVRDRDRDRDGDTYRRPPPSDSYIPGSSRRPRSRSPRRSPPSYRRRSRSRTPPRRYADDARDRARSPPRRGYSPRRDDGRRENRMRSPLPPPPPPPPPPRYRERSPAPPKRPRDPSPYSRERAYRSPPLRRERYGSPRRHESPPRRAYSPQARETVDDRNYRRRSRSPAPRRDDESRYESRRLRSPSPRRPSGPVSAATSGRSSPKRPYANDHAAAIDSASYRSPRMSPEPRNGVPVGPARNGAPTGPRTGPPPTGPAGSRSFASPSGTLPSGPARTSSVSILSAPSRPRGRGGFHPGGPGRDFSGGAPGAPRRASDFSGGAAAPQAPYGGPPAGPRGSRPPPFRGSSNSTSTTYPRTLRFQHHLADMNAIMPGGKTVDYRDPTRAAKIRKLEEDAERLRAEIADKERAARKVVQEWDRLEMDANRAETRAELVRENLQTLERLDVASLVDSAADEHEAYDDAPLS